MKIKTFVILSVFFLLIGALVWFFIKDYEYKNQVIRANITLKNNCELIDAAFMVTSYPENKNAYFDNKKAVMYLKRSSKVQLQANNKYEGFHYSSVPVEVKENLILEANCTEEGRLEDIFNSLKEQFKE
ncbi:MAG: hypothetical protein CFH34_01176 [Alphaproteobacteria bacterium MarineAlpha9_Bin4]|nr:hypothetical protein [Pelagibacterales bacterium]PPR26004.1 MAG: hypothetical protein CFH34_01176 [Alphaproteobacteria bacterium MarineAlpha9_Bin4]|tara:strand:- start:1001 stop:1387 length:387 start_codon:yes stop_codon:yes gene_type:complete